MNLLKNNEDGFASFFALIALVAIAFMGSGLYFISKENAETARHHEIATQLRYDAESAVEKIAYDIKEKNLILPDNIKNIVEYVVPDEYLPKVKDTDIILKVSVKYENGGLRIFSVAEKTNEPYIVIGTAEGFMKEVEGVYEWKYWIKVKSN